MRLLLVDDDEPLMEALSGRLKDRRYAIDIATAGDMAWEFISLFDYDLVVLDRMLPNIDGVSLCKKLRAQGHTMPILMLTACGDNTDIIEGLNAGADDYVVKPFNFAQLVARIHALLRRPQEALPPILRWGDLSLNPDTLEVANGDRPLNLTPKEYEILELLLRNSNHVFTVDAIIDRIWTLDQPTDSAVRTHIKCLRQKLKAAGVSSDMIETVYGIGYRLTTPPRSIASQEIDAEAPKQLQKGTSTEMAEVLETFKAVIHERITVLDRAATALKADELADELYQQARLSAHQLAGSLGSFGFPQGSTVAKAIEDILTSQPLSTPVAKQQFYENLKTLRQVVDQQSLDEPGMEQAKAPLLLLVGDDSKFIQALVTAATVCQLRTVIASSFSQAKAVINADAPAMLLLDLSSTEDMLEDTLDGSATQTADSAQFELLEKFHHQAPSLPIVAILPKRGYTNAKADSLSDRLDIIRRGGRMLLFQPIMPAQAIAAVTQLLKQTGVGAKILVVDDDPCVLQKIQISLAPWGFEINTLANPLEVLSVLDEVVPDLLVLDIEMPDVNGLELCQILRSEPRWNRLPIIFLTVHQDAKTQRRAFAAGADDYVEKTIVGADLANRILNRLARVRAV